MEPSLEDRAGQPLFLGLDVRSFYLHGMMHADEYQSFPSSIHDIFPEILQSTSDLAITWICMQRTCFYFRYVLFSTAPLQSSWI